MKNLVNDISKLAVRVDPQYLRLAVLIMTVSLLVVGAGAPAGGGGGLPG